MDLSLSTLYLSTNHSVSMSTSSSVTCSDAACTVDTPVTDLPPALPASPTASTDQHSSVDDGLQQLLKGSWTVEQFSSMEVALRRWAKRTAGLQLVHDSKRVDHHRTCPKASHHKLKAEEEKKDDNGIDLVHT